MCPEGGSAKGARRKSRKKKALIQERRKKVFTYKGMTIEELKKMDINEFAKISTARVRRSLLRGFNDEQKKVVDKIIKASPDKVVKTHQRDIIILPKFVGKKVAVYNGKEFKEITIRAEMIGHYLGEFSETRRFEKHSGPGVGATKSSKFMPLK